MQKVVRSNIDRVSQMSIEHQRERETFMGEIRSLKTENSILKTKLEELSFQIGKNQER